ncbi:MAG TPA: leucine-rich repeat domain-containing protein [Candidatus Lokiarchaeia archaeon]|nr:leucine-rich repeat domain-containing protein [Candidatus Lokiarchaeia archaeon]
MEHDQQFTPWGRAEQTKDRKLDFETIPVETSNLAQKSVSNKESELIQDEQLILGEIEKQIGCYILKVDSIQWGIIGFSASGGKVTGLGLHGQEVVSLPETIGTLSSLQILDLRENLLFSLSVMIGKLSSLQVLDLGKNQLHSLPETVGELQSLKELYLTNNRLFFLPKTITNLVLLEQLWLNDNPLVLLPATIRKWMSDLKKHGCEIHS